MNATPERQVKKKPVNGYTDWWKWLASASVAVNITLLSVWPWDAISRSELLEYVSAHANNTFAHESEGARRSRIADMLSPFNDKLTRLDTQLDAVQKQLRDIERKVDARP
jgi:septal ring factor EnvC (AmiA/AmiB activator)